MRERERGTIFFRATNSFERINVGDMVLVDVVNSPGPQSIALTSPDFIIKRVDLSISEEYLGKVIRVLVNH